MRLTMTYSRLQNWKLLPALLVLFLGACFTSERTDLVLINVDLTEVPDTTSLKISMLDDTTKVSLKEKEVVPSTKPEAKIALSQTEGMTTVQVRVTAFAGSQRLGEGTGIPVTVTRGKNAGPVLVTIKKDQTGSDAGTSDSATMGPDSGLLDSGSPDQLARDSSPSTDAIILDGDPGQKTDAQLLADVGTVYADALPALDSRGDLAAADSSGLADAAIDQATIPIDATLDLAPDTSGGPLSMFNTCKRYIHFPDPPATCPSSSNQYDVMVNTVLFTPDGNFLVTAANNAWVKLWKVVGNTLEDTGAVFVGDNYKVTAAVSPSGDLLAVVNQSGNVDLYNLKTSMTTGAVSKVGVLPANKLKSGPDQYYNRATFTSDGKQLIVLYPSQSSMTNAMIAIWDVEKQTLIRELDYNYKNWPYSAAPLPSTGPLWGVLGITDSLQGDGGSYYRTTLMLEDLSGATPDKPTFAVLGDVNKTLWSTDFNTLAIGTDNGDVTLWDVSNKGAIKKSGDPVAASTVGGQAESVYSLAFSTDGQSLAVGSGSYTNTTLKLVNLQTRTSVQKRTDFETRSIAFSNDGTAWAYGLGGCGYVYFCKN